MNEQDLQERVEEFFRTFENEEGNLLYWPLIQCMSINDETTITINFQHLEEFEKKIIHFDISSQKFLEVLDNAFRAVLRLEDPDYVNSMDSNLLHTYIIKHPLKLKPSHLIPRQIGQLMTVSGFVIDASVVKPLLKKGLFLCRICQTEIPQDQEHGLPKEPVMCPVCTKKTSMKLVDSRSYFVDFQSCRLQDIEPIAGQVPTDLEAYLEGDLAGQVAQGETVSLTGLLRTLPRKDTQATFDYYLDVIGVEHHTPSVQGKEQFSVKNEEDLEDLLQKHPHLLGYGFRVLERQMKTTTGRIDLLMEAPDTGIVVLELKADKGERDVVGQIQEYMTWAQQKYGPQRKVRGIIVADGFSEGMVASLQGSKYHIRLVELSSIVPVGDRVREHD